jgi:hypothetical protein
MDLFNQGCNVHVLGKFRQFLLFSNQRLLTRRWFLPQIFVWVLTGTSPEEEGNHHFSVFDT